MRNFFKKTCSVVLALLMTNLLGIAVLAEEPITDYYVIETNEDGSDPVYILLDESNSDVDHNYTGEKEEGKSYTPDTNDRDMGEKVYRVLEEQDDVSKLIPHDTYSFTVEEMNVGDIIATVPEGGAELEFVTEGKDEEFYYRDASEKTVTEVFKADIEMVEEFVSYCATLPDKEQYILDELKRGLYQFGVENLNEITTVEQATECFVQAQWGKIMQDYGPELVAIVFPEGIERIRAELDEQIDKRQKLYDTTLASLAVPSEENPYAEMLAEMKAVDSDDEEAILAYLGMTKEQFLQFKGNLDYSHTPVVKNSGMVNVIEAGTGFDECYSGAIFYTEGYGWTYACDGGGVPFGEASGLNLYSVERVEINTLPTDAFSVTAVSPVQLNRDGTGIVELSNIEAYVDIPDGQGGTVRSRITSFEFLDDSVELGTDAHATAIIGGRFYSVELKLKEWSGEGDIPVRIVPIPAPQTEIQAEAPVTANVNGQTVQVQIWISGEALDKADKLTVDTVEEAKLAEQADGNEVVGIFDLSLVSGVVDLKNNTLNFKLGSFATGQEFTLMYFVNGELIVVYATVDANGILSFPYRQVGTVMLVQGHVAK